MADVTVRADAALLSTSNNSEFSWWAAIAGALFTSTVIFILLFLGAGIGLSLATVANAPPASADAARSAITYGALYFFFALAFGGLVGGYLAGRLMGPLLEPTNEELFLASAHGLGSWTIAVIATATMAAISGLSLAGPSLNAAAILGASSGNDQRPGQSTNDIGAYWVDMLLRPAAVATPAAPGVAGAAQASSVSAPASMMARPADMDLRSEAGRLLTFGLVRDGMLSMEDHDRLATIVSQSAGVDAAEANRRIDDVQLRIRNAAAAAAEATRQAARTLALWLAASLAVGGFAAAAGAVTGRSVDDKARGLSFKKA